MLGVFEENRSDNHQEITRLTYWPVPPRRVWNLSAFTDTPLGAVLRRPIIFNSQALKICRNFPAPVCWHPQSILLLRKWDMLYPEKLRQLVIEIMAQNPCHTSEVHHKTWAPRAEISSDCPSTYCFGIML